MALDWSAVIKDHHLDGAIYAIGVQVQGKKHINGVGIRCARLECRLDQRLVVPAVLISTAFIEDLNPRAFAVKSGTEVGGADTYWLQNFWVHPDYDGTAGTPNAALLFIDANLTQTSFFLPRDQMQGLQAGQPVGTIGFLEELSEEPVNVPIAAFKDGTISSLRPFRGRGPDACEQPGDPAQPGRARPYERRFHLRSPGIHHRHELRRASYRVAYDQCTVKPTRIVSDNPGLAIRVDELWRRYVLARGAGEGRARGVEGAHGCSVRSGTRVRLSALILQALRGWLDRRDDTSVRKDPCRLVRAGGNPNLNIEKPRSLQRGFFLKTALPFRWPKLLLGTSGKA